MNAIDLRKKNVDELTTELHALLKEQFNLRIQQGSGQAPKSHLIAKARRGIARIKTILTEKEKGSSV